MIVLSLEITTPSTTEKEFRLLPNLKTSPDLMAFVYGGGTADLKGVIMGGNGVLKGSRMVCTGIPKLDRRWHRV